MQMQPGRLPPPPKLIPILANGFNVVANHVTLVLMPVLLDLYLWLGPRLGLKQIYEPIVAQIPIVGIPGGPTTTEILTIRQNFLAFFERFNLLTLLRTFPVGVNSLMLGWQPLESPVGKPVIHEISSLLTALGGLLLVTAAGWILGGLYFHWLSKVTLELSPQPATRTVAQIILLSLVVIAAVLVIGIPLVWLYLLISLISPALGQGLFFLFTMFSLWLVLPVFFAPHGIYINRENAFTSILSSLRMMRYTLPSSGLFMVGIFVISQGLGYLWHVPAEGSWWMLVSIFGHAFVTTGLLAASFLYYREINAWLKAVFDQLKIQTTSTRA